MARNTTPVEDIGAVTAHLDSVKRDREGVSMFLMVEDFGPAGSADAPSGIDADGPILADLADHYADRMLRDPAAATEAQVAQVLEVLAATHFVVDRP
jgi:hypothetical protein